MSHQYPELLEYLWKMHDFTYRLVHLLLHLSLPCLCLTRFRNSTNAFGLFFFTLRVEVEFFKRKSPVEGHRQPYHYAWFRLTSHYSVGPEQLCICVRMRDDFFFPRTPFPPARVRVGVQRPGRGSWLWGGLVVGKNQPYAAPRVFKQICPPQKKRKNESGKN